MTSPWQRCQLLLATLMIGFLLTGCTDESRSSLSSAGTNALFLIEPRLSVGKIKAGMKVADVVSVYGEPQRRTANSLSYPRLGFAVMPDANGLIKVVMCGDVTGFNGPLVQAFSGRTKEGIGLGSTREQVISAYGEPTQTQTFPGRRESLGYSQMGMTFSLEQGKVHHIIVRLEEPSQPENTIRITPLQE